MTEEIRQLVRETIYKEMKWAPARALGDNSLLIEEGVESLKAITILYQIEETLNIRIPNELVGSCQTVSDIVSNITILMGDNIEN